MSFAVAYQIDYLGVDGIKKGDVIMANHPAAGVSRLMAQCMVDEPRLTGS